MKKVGWGSGFGERVGWNLGEVGERVGWRMGGRERQLHNFTYEWMLWDLVGCVILDTTKWWCKFACMRSSFSYLTCATQHEKTWVRGKKNATSPFCIHKNTQVSFFQLLMKICCCCSCTNPEMVGPISCTQHCASLSSLSLSPLVFQLQWQIWLVVSFAKFVQEWSIPSFLLIYTLHWSRKCKLFSFSPFHVRKENPRFYLGCVYWGHITSTLG